MKHDKIIKDHRGTLRIEASIWVGNYWEMHRFDNEFRYDVTVWHKPPKKRKEIINLEIATEEEVESVKIELWNKLKP